MEYTTQMQYVCKECKKTAPMELILCGTCGDYNGVTPMPEGWKYWPMASNQHSWPKPIICVECLDEKEFEEETKKIKEAEKARHCRECHSQKY